MAKKQHQTESGKASKNVEKKFHFLFSLLKVNMVRHIFKWGVCIAVILCAYFVCFPKATIAQSLFSIRSIADSLTSKIASKETEIDTFEITCTEADITAKTVKVLPTGRHVLSNAKLLYTPCLLLDVKYSRNSRTTETSRMLWNLLEGELILSTDSFHETSGFYDCLKSKANIDDFRVLHTLASHGGTMTKETLLQQSGIDEEKAPHIIESLRYRHLITTAIDGVRLHVKNPLFRVEPETKITRHIVQRKIQTIDTILEVFSEYQIESLIQNAYGKDIAIIDSNFVWIPVWQLDITNPDGSVRKTFWNALSGKELGARSISTLIKYAK